MKRLVILICSLGWSLVSQGALPADSPLEPVVRAQLTPRRMAVLSAELSAKITRLHVLEGGTFSAGDTLVSFDDLVQRAQVERAEAALTAAQRTYAANQRLHTLNSIGQIELDLSEADVGKAQADLSLATTLLNRCQVKAPFCGRVSEERVHAQEFVQAGQPLIEIIDDEPPQIDFIAPSKWLAWLEVGQPFTIQIDETAKSYPAVIERIGARVDPVSQSIKVVAGLRGKFPELIAGMSGVVSLAPPTARDRQP